MSLAERALVTGGAGMIGSAIVDALVDDGVQEVVVVDDLSRGCLANLEGALARGNVTMLEGSVGDRSLVRHAMEGVDVVFHQAAIRLTQCATEPRMAIDVLVNGTFNVVEAAAREGVRRLVAASSASVYGSPTQLPTAEDHAPWTNRTLYGAAKAFGEGLLRAFYETHGLEYVALRYFNVYGPRMDTRGRYTEVFVRWMDRIAAGKPLVIHGDGSRTADYVYVDDVVQANLIAARSDVRDDVFNVASGVETQLDELARALLSAMGAEGVEPTFAAERELAPVLRRQGDTSRAREVLGFEVRVGLDEGLRRLVEWWRGSQQ